jgi:hypothetical protein
LSFSSDGRRIVTGSSDRTARVWDVARTEAIVRERAIVMTAALACGLGYRTDGEAADLLMQDAPEDMFAAAMERLGDRSIVNDVVGALRAPLHPRCYLSPTQLAERRGRAHDRRGTARWLKVLASFLCCLRRSLALAQRYGSLTLWRSCNACVPCSHADELAVCSAPHLGSASQASSSFATAAGRTFERT